MDQPHNDKVLLLNLMLKMPSTAYAETPFFKSSKTPPRNLSLHTGLLFFKNIPLSWKLQSRFGHRCATRKPLSPALFLLAIHEVTSKIKADLNIWYLDDGCIGGDPQTVVTNATMIRDSLSSTGLEINNFKCELLFINHTDINKPQTRKLFQDQFPSLSIPDPIHWLLLGYQLHQESAPVHLKAVVKVE